jgi:predicted flap endonuclease-1-like 5' DNA nuclease
MKSKHIQYFWIGFSLAAIAAALIYWLLRSKREILSGPIIVRKESAKPIADGPDTNTEAKSDDLARIQGIGPAYGQQLNDAGIYTFEQLALATPKNIRQFTGVSRWDPEEWITEANELSKQADANG